MFAQQGLGYMVQQRAFGKTIERGGILNRIHIQDDEEDQLHLLMRFRKHFNWLRAHMLS